MKHWKPKENCITIAEVRESSLGPAAAANYKRRILSLSLKLSKLLRMMQITRPLPAGGAKRNRLVGESEEDCCNKFANCSKENTNYARSGVMSLGRC